MKMNRFLLLLLTFSSAVHSPLRGESLVCKNALKDLHFLENLLQVKYAPKVWKEEYLGWNLSESVVYAQQKLCSVENPSTSFCQQVIADFIQELNDFHAGVTFYAVENAYLPYSLQKSSDGHFYFVDVMTFSSDIRIGDELLEVDGCPVEEVLATLYGGNHKGTLAEESAALRTLFSRMASLGHEVPSGRVSLKVRRPSSGSIKEVRVQWRYTPEGVGDLSAIAPSIKAPQLQKSMRGLFPKRDNHHASSLFHSPMVPHFWAELRNHYATSGLKSGYNIGNADGFFPVMGPVLWESEGPFHAYIFPIVDERGIRHNIGFLRIATYGWQEMEDVDPMGPPPWEEFAKIIDLFSLKTDALIIDQTNNPGGSVLYLYGLLSMLTDRPLNLPKHRMILTQDEVVDALDWKKLLESVDTDAEARLVLGENMEGYTVNLQVAEYLKSFSDQVLACWQNGDIELSNPIPLFGFEQIHPHPRVQYNKPICVLINEQDFSCADFFPAVLKDNDRALVVGSRTAGAGGFVFNVEFPNRTGIKSCSLTGSLAVRMHGDLIENIGVEPHIEIPFTANDIRHRSYSEYFDKIKKLVCQLINNDSVIMISEDDS
ncbi:protease-like activity factor CPAF [Chlamydia sp.]|uniref:protease-like activity factor CPAF n=1 Tax=Chlamydia sp. TaxID=35827 RepID=UPI0025BB3771|nr:protease-like activity factor CPAF [Chlamydia sp.]MBQ8498494.1 protease-like activity factor CPAF [Chlamydia sp.]